MAKYSLPEMSVAKMQHNPAVFQGVSFTPQAADMNILARSLAQAEERHNKAVEKRSELDKTLADLESKLHNDKETQQWFANYKSNIEKQIQDEVDNGNYGSAIRVATSLAGKVWEDPAMQGRIRAEEDFQQEVKTQQARRDKGEISQNTYDWWMANNPYKYEDNYDSEGNIIGGTQYVAESRPVADVNWAAQAQAAFKMITPYKRSVSSQTSTSTSSSTDGTGSSQSSSSGSAHQEEKVTKQDILDNIEELLSSTSDGYRQAEQAFDVAKFETDKMLKEYEDLIAKDPNSDNAKIMGQKLEARRKLMYKNGSPIDYKEYYARMITNNLYADKLAYDWLTDSTSSSSSTGNTTVTGGGGSGRTTSSKTGGATGGAYFDYLTGTWKGPNVRQSTDTGGAQRGIGAATSGISNRFGG